MNIRNFSDTQRQAFVDLLVLGMYSDGNLAAAEEALVQGVLDVFEFESEYARNQYLDASIARVRDEAHTADTARAYAVRLAQNFSSPDQRRTVHDALERLLASDKGASGKDSEFLSVVKEVFKL